MDGWTTDGRGRTDEWVVDLDLDLEFGIVRREGPERKAKSRKPISAHQPEHTA